MTHHSVALIVTVLVITTVLAPSAFASTIQTDKTGIVTSVIDGNSFKLNNVETIKLAEIITPQSGQPGFEASTSYLAGLIQGETVFLDVDSRTVTEQEKLLCVVYLDYNSTHYENINKAMLENHYAAPSTVSITEFNPASWTWFVAKQEATPTPTAEATAQPTAAPSPSPTPFSPPTPSITPNVSQPSATETIAPQENTQNTAVPLQTWIIVAMLAVVIVCALLIALIYKRR